MRTPPSLYFRFVRWLHQFEEFPRYNKWGAGLYQLLWIHYCGHDWAYAYRVARGYWRA